MKVKIYIWKYDGVSTYIPSNLVKVRYNRILFKVSCSDIIFFFYDALGACAHGAPDIRDTLRHSVLSSARVLASSKVKFCFCKSFCMVASQVVVCPPLGFFTLLCASCSATFAGVSSGILMTWPYHFTLLFRIMSLHLSCLVILYSSSLAIFRGHLMFSAFLSSLRWNESILFSLVLFKVHISELNKNILSHETCQLNTKMPPTKSVWTSSKLK